MKYVIYNKTTGEILRANAQSVGMYITNYKSESAAKAALTRAVKKHARQLEISEIYRKLAPANPNFRDLRDALKTAGLTEREAYNARMSKVEDFDRNDYDIDTAEAYREEFPIKMVERVNLMSGKTYMEAENTPNSCSPASEAYWSM